ncbi:serine-rich adhesin for platelets-like, partial [Argopecten irradians]|uniref:serine-rich adhesin for platelets-like n=1 Tax=Argopecten irradians TaxID=31199 RepID=UPI00371498AE
CNISLSQPYVTLLKTVTKMDVQIPYVVLVFLTILHLTSGRGKMVEPPQRSSLWRHEEWNGKPMVATNNDDGGLNCGGYWKLHEVNHHRCGICGDAWDNKDRPNEAGGRYAQGYIARTYYHDKSKLINVTVDIEANIGGYFEFRLCPNNDITRKITQECLDKHHLVINGYGHRLYVERDTVYDLQLKIPEDLTCTQCVLQWKWKGSHYWGMCDDGYGGIGCGDQEEYYNCADIAILTSNDTATKDTKNTKESIIHDPNDPRIHAWSTGATERPAKDTTSSWVSGNSISTPSWLQDLLLVASEMEKPNKEKKHHKQHKHTKSKSGTVSSAAPMLNVTSTTIPVHNITTLHGNDTYHNVTYDVENSTDGEVNTTDLGLVTSEHFNNESTVDLGRLDLVHMNNTNDTESPGQDGLNTSGIWVEADPGQKYHQKPDTGSPVVKGIPISDIFLQTDNNALHSETELPWENSAIPSDNSLNWNKDIHVSTEKESKTFWAVSNAIGSTTPDQETAVLHKHSNKDNITEPVSDLNTNIVHVTHIPTSTGKATTGTLFNVYSTTSDVETNTEQTTDAATTDVQTPEQSSDAAFRNRIGSPGIPILAKDYMDIMGQGTISPSPPTVTMDNQIPATTDYPSSAVHGHSIDNKPMVLTTAVTEQTLIENDVTTDVIHDVITDMTTSDSPSTDRTKIKSVIDEFAINTENMPHILEYITTPSILSVTVQPTTPPSYHSSTFNYDPSPDTQSTDPTPTNTSENILFESSNNTLFELSNFTKNNISLNESFVDIFVNQTSDVITDVMNTTDITTHNDSYPTTDAANYTENPQSTSTSEVQLQRPRHTLVHANTAIETTTEGIISHFDKSTAYSVTKEMVENTVSTTPNYGSEPIWNEGQNGGDVIARNENNPEILIKNVTDVLKNSSGTENLQWILSGHMTKSSPSNEGIPIPHFGSVKAPLLGGAAEKVDIRTNKANVRASMVQTYRPRNKPDAVLKPTNFSAQNKSAYRTNLFTGPSNIRNDPTTTESFIQSNHHSIHKDHGPKWIDISANMRFQETSTTGKFDSVPIVGGAQAKPTPTTDNFKPDMILPRGSISFKSSGKKTGQNAASPTPEFHNNGQLSYGGQDIIDAGRTVGIPLSQIRPGIGGVLSDGRQIISGLDFVDTDLQYETGNRTVAMPLIGNAADVASIASNAQIEPPDVSMAFQSPVAMRRISQESPMDKVGGDSFMHPPPPSERLNMRPNQVMEDIMRKLTPEQNSQGSQRPQG